MPNVLIVSQGAAFLTDSIETNLKKESINTFRCDPDILEVSEMLVGVEIVILFAGSYLAEDSIFLDQLVLMCEDEFIHFCVVGYPNEIAIIEKQVNVSRISVEFVRPFDMKDFVAGIRALAFNETAKSSSSSSGLSFGGKKHHILICDSDAEYLKALRDSLSDLYRVTAVKSGFMAATAASSSVSKPELILLAYDMPIISGPMTLETIRADKKSADIPVVLLSERSDKETVMSVMKLRPNGYMLKSTKLYDILASIDNFFATGQWKLVQ